MVLFSMNPKAKADEDAKDREENVEHDEAIVEAPRDHGNSRDKRSLLNTLASDQDVQEAEFVPKGAKRHFTIQRSTLSGPGTLTDGPGIGPNSSSPAAPFVTGAFGKISNVTPFGPAVQNTLDGEDTHTNIIALASNLPPAIDTNRVKELFSDHPRLKVTRIVPHPSKPSASGSRPSTQFKIYFDRGTTANDLTHFTNAYNDTKYMGKGYYLHIDRFRNDSDLSKKAEPAPFGATETKRDTGVAPPTEFGGKGIAPPAELGGRGGGRGGAGAWGRGRVENRHVPEDKEMLVTVQAPKDVAMLRLIHMTVENVIKGGIEFEAALMEDPQVQEQERFAWLYLHDHPYHRYYRWRLYQLVTGSGGDHVSRATIFENEADWRGPKNPFEDEFACEFVDLSKPRDNNDRDEEEHLTYDNIGIYSNVDSYAAGILTPLRRTLLIHYLSAMPISEKIKNDDVAFFSMFAVEASAQGRDEVVDLLITNIFHPFALSKAKTGQGQGPADIGESSKRLSTATVNALCILSDVAWVTSKGGHISYRRYIEQQLVERKVFEYLQTVPSRFVGKLNTGPFRNGVNEVLDGWKEEGLFDVEKLKHYDSAFNERTRQEEAEMKAKKVMEKREREKQRGNASRPLSNLGGLDGAYDVDTEQSGGDNDTGTAASPRGEGEKEQEREKAHLASDIATEAGDSVDAGETFDRLSSMKGITRHQTEQPAAPTEIAGESAAARARRLRPKAEDMIALDDE